MNDDDEINAELDRIQFEVNAQVTERGGPPYAICRESFAALIRRCKANSKRRESMNYRSRWKLLILKHIREEK